MNRLIWTCTPRGTWGPRSNPGPYPDLVRWGVGSQVPLCTIDCGQREFPGTGNLWMLIRRQPFCRREQGNTGICSKPFRDRFAYEEVRMLRRTKSVLSEWQEAIRIKHVALSRGGGAVAFGIVNGPGRH
jgi:hypothetical protein